MLAFASWGMLWVARAEIDLRVLGGFACRLEAKQQGLASHVGVGKAAANPVCHSRAPGSRDVGR